MVNHNRRGITATNAAVADAEREDEEEDVESVDTSLYTSDEIATIPYLRTTSMDDGASIVTNGTDAFFREVRRSKQGKKPKRIGDGWDSGSSSSSQGDDCSSTSMDEYGFDGNSLYDLELQSHTMISIDTPRPMAAKVAPVGTVVSTIRRSMHEQNSFRSKSYSRRTEHYERYRRYKICLISMIALALAVSVGMVVLLFLNDDSSSSSSLAAAAVTPAAITRAPTTAAPTIPPTKAPVVPPATAAPVAASTTTTIEESSGTTTEGGNSIGSTEVDEKEEEEEGSAVTTTTDDSVTASPEVELQEPTTNSTPILEPEAEAPTSSNTATEAPVSTTTATEEPISTPVTEEPVSTTTPEIPVSNAAATEESVSTAVTEAPASTTATEAVAVATEAPVPTSAPTETSVSTEATEVPIASEEPCVDTNLPVLSVATKLQGCDWLASRPAAMVLFCSEEAIGQQCPVACGTCTRRLK